MADQLNEADHDRDRNLAVIMKFLPLRLAARRTDGGGWGRNFMITAKGWAGE